MTSFITLHNLNHFTELAFKVIILRQVGVAGNYYSQSSGGWTRCHGDPLVDSSLSRMATIVSTDQGAHSGHWPHIVIFTLLSSGHGAGHGPSLPLEVTRGLYEVIKILHWDKHDNM